MRRPPMHRKAHNRGPVEAEGDKRKNIAFASQRAVATAAGQNHLYRPLTHTRTTGRDANIM